MRLAFLILFVFCFLHAGAQVYVRDSINRVDANGKRQGYWVVTASMKKLGPPWAPDQTVEEGSYIDSRKDGRWIEYYPDGQVKTDKHFINGRVTGFSTSYYQNPHMLKEECTYLSSRYIGQYKFYYPDGRLKYHYNYDSTGLKQGPQFSWYDNGQLQLEANYVHGKQHGWTREYYSNGLLKRETFYTSGTNDATKTKNYPENDPNKKALDPIPPQRIPPCPADCKDCECKDGKIWNGQVRVYDQNGLLMQITIYKDGKYVGDAPLTDEKK